MSQQWYFYKNNMVVGPIESDDLLACAKAGDISPETYVRLSGNKEWFAASTVKGLFTGAPRYVSDDDKTEMLPVTAGIPTAGSVNQESFLAKESNSELNEFFESNDIDAITCSHCWAKFSISQINYISSHVDLIGDEVLGASAQKRFLPTKFTPQGHAIDEKGQSCVDMACPNCHLPIPKGIIEQESLFFSIVGAPASGKTYFLTTLIWKLRQDLPRLFNISLTDSDVLGNSILTHYEEQLFRNTAPDKVTMLDKTELFGSNAPYEQVNIRGMQINLPKPFTFAVRPFPTHFSFQEGNDNLSKNLILYDNAGEHFEAGRDTPSNPGTNHLTSSKGIIFLFDPSKDAIMLNRCDSSDPQVSHPSKLTSQSVLFNEMVNRILSYGQVRGNSKYEHPLIIAINKYDMWKDVFSEIDVENLSDTNYSEEDFCHKLNYPRIMDISYRLRSLMMTVAPELVMAAESFASQVFFMPMSVLGHAPEELENGGLGIRPSDIKPSWVTTPLLLLLSTQGYIQVDHESEQSAIEVEEYQLVDEKIIFTIPNTKAREVLPINYTGIPLYHELSNTWFKLAIQHEPSLEDPDDNSTDFWNS